MRPNTTGTRTARCSVPSGDRRPGACRKAPTGTVWPTPPPQPRSELEKPGVSCRGAAAGNSAKPDSRSSCKNHNHFSLDSQSQIAIYLLQIAIDGGNRGNTSAAERVIIEE